MQNQASTFFSAFTICLLIFSIGCKPQDIPPNFDMEALNDYVVNDGMPDFQREINDYLEPRMPTCDGTTGLEDFDPVLDRTGSCVEFDASLYNTSDAGEKISKAIKGAKNKKAAFEKYFGPLAVYVQSRTGYPASALLAQWADETAWGTSKQVRVNNNIGGHSCFKYNEEYSYPPASRGEAPDFAKPPFKVECTYKRPSNEGSYYMTFANMIDASLSQVYNILHNPATHKNYASARKVVGEALRDKVKPDPARVIRGLNGYAAFPPDYKERLIKHMRNEGYEEYDNRDICREEKSEEAKEEAVDNAPTNPLEQASDE